MPNPEEHNASTTNIFVLNASIIIHASILQTVLTSCQCLYYQFSLIYFKLTYSLYTLSSKEIQFTKLSTKKYPHNHSDGSLW